MITLCPSLRSRTAVSTMEVRIERSGSWVFSSTIEDVPSILSQILEGLQRLGMIPSLITIVKDFAPFILVDRDTFCKGIDAKSCTSVGLDKALNSRLEQ